MEINDYNGAFLPDDDGSEPDLVAEAQCLVDKLQFEVFKLCSDYPSDGASDITDALPPHIWSYLVRLSQALLHAEKRLERRMDAEPFSEADYYDADEYYAEFYSDMDVPY